jgi:hypothetical protein
MGKLIEFEMVDESTGKSLPVHIDEETGAVFFLHNDALAELATEGEFLVERASNVEWFATTDGMRMGWIVLTPNGDPWSCSMCYGNGLEEYQHCGCCIEKEGCENCLGTGFEVFATREDALKHESTTLNYFMDMASKSCEFDPYGFIGSQQSKGSYTIN